MTDWTIASLSQAIRARQVSPVEVVESCLSNVGRWDRSLRCFISLDTERARRIAREREEELAAGKWRGPLHGVPVGYKDLFVVLGFPTSCGTRKRDYFASRVEATAASRLAEAGAVPLGKLNMSELAMGAFGDNAHHGDVQNPWRPGYVAGGSSSGSAGALAARFILGALGTDTGGSIRLPAACCGVVGLKPTYGRVSRTGVMPLSWSLDHVGPMARDVWDVAVLLSVIAGQDRSDPTSSRYPIPSYSALDGRVAGLRIAVPLNHYFEGCDGQVERAIHATIGILESLGAHVRQIRIPAAGLHAVVGNVILRCESAAAHWRVLGRRSSELQPVVRARLIAGLRFRARTYVQAIRLRARLTEEFVEHVFSNSDVLVTPVISEPPPTLKAVKAGGVQEVTRRMAQFSRLTRPFNLLGLPALSLPCGFSQEGLPLAVQLVARPFDEAMLLRIGHAYERETQWSARLPSYGLTRGIQ